MQSGGKHPADLDRDAEFNKDAYLSNDNFISLMIYLHPVHVIKKALPPRLQKEALDMLEAEYDRMAEDYKNDQAIQEYESQQEAEVLREMGDYHETLNPEKEYDLAFSFVGENRDYVERVKVECEKLRLRVFYDKDSSNALWGKNWLEELRKVYKDKAHYFVPFISSGYFQSKIPSDEFQTATAALMDKMTSMDKLYILPVTIGDADIPEHKLSPHIHRLKSEDFTPAELAQQFLSKVKRPHISKKDSNKQPGGHDSSLTAPRLTPRTFSKYEEREKTIRYLAEQFRLNIDKLRESDLVGTVQTIDSTVQIRVEDNGETVFSLNIFADESMGEASIGFNLDSDNSSKNSFSAVAQPYFDKESGSSLLKFSDFGLFGVGDVNILTDQKLFKKLWSYMIKVIEGNSDR